VPSLSTHFLFTSCIDVNLLPNVQVNWSQGGVAIQEGAVYHWGFLPPHSCGLTSVLRWAGATRGGSLWRLEADAPAATCLLYS